jgi:hypothetical protein
MPKLAIFIKAINGNLNLPVPHHGLVKWQSVAGCKIADKDRSQSPMIYLLKRLFLRVCSCMLFDS